MPATLLYDTLPQIARVGFDHGWLLLGPTFLNLGMSTLLVDKAFIDASAYGLEPFGARDPHDALPTSHLVVERSGRFVGIREGLSPGRTVIAIGAFACPNCLSLLSTSERVVVAVGDTWAAEQSWSALWRFDLGIATVGWFQGARSTDRHKLLT